MKKIFLLLLVPFFFACDINNWQDTVITNNSTHEVTFKFSNTEEITLGPDEAIIFETKAYQHLEYHHPFKDEHHTIIVEFIFNATDEGYIGLFRNWVPPEPEPEP